MRSLIFYPVLSLFLTLSGCPATPEGGEGGAPWAAFLPFVVIFVLFYVLILRPQQRQQKQRRELLGSIKRGDTVITSGGIYGKIQSIAEDGLVVLEIAKGVNVRILKENITGRRVIEEKQKGKEEKKKEKEKT